LWKFWVCHEALLRIVCTHGATLGVRTRIARSVPGVTTRH
jgi:hypothetical protein